MPTLRYAQLPGEGWISGPLPPPAHPRPCVLRAYLLALCPAVVGISSLRSGLPTGRIALFFSERPVSLRTSVLHPCSTVLEIRSFRATYGARRKVVLPSLSGRRQPPISKFVIAGSATRGLYQRMPIIGREHPTRNHRCSTIRAERLATAS
jgi:hypothetical protein